jgi:phospholipid/cholesterol/gamma-HCH transport system substrate-binding protein
MRTPMRPVSRIAALLALLVAGLVALTGCGSVYDLPLPGGANVGSNPVKVHVLFRDVLDLVPQSTVKVDDVTVGKVTAIRLKGYTADVTVELPRDVDLPSNATAQIRQTSLLGEKFVSLESPADPSSTRLRNGDVIGLDRTGRNPEIEEVFSALALLLNGGGVGQLKTIAEELNTALGGRESDVRSIITQIRSFMSQLDQNKSAIVSAIDNVDRLAVQLRRQDGSIKSALDNLPAALKSINGQRRDLVRMLQALDRLSGVGVRVIQASKASTIDSLRDLAPVLTSFARAGQNMPRALQVFLTYPFVDAAVGNDPQVARNLHMGDFTNLSVRLDLDLAGLPTLPSLPGAPGPVCDTVAQLTAAAQQAANQIVDPLPNPPFTSRQKTAIKKKIVAALVAEFRDQCHTPSLARLVHAGQALLPAVLQALGLDQLLGSLPTNLPTGLPTALPTALPTSLGLGRAGLGAAYRKPKAADPFHLAARGVDPSLGTLLLQGLAVQR